MFSVVEKDSVRAGLLIFKPIKMPQNLPQSGNSALHSAIVQNAFSQRPTQSGGVFPSSNFKTNFDFKSLFPAFQAAAQTANGGHPQQSALQANGYQSPPQPNNGYQATPVANGYKPTNGFQTPQTAGGFPSFQDQGYSATLQQNAGYPAQSDYRYPPTGSGSAAGAEHVPGQGYGLQNFDFAPMPSSQEFNQQLAELAGEQHSQQQQAFDGFGGGDQHNSASSSEDRVVRPASYKHLKLQAEAPKPKARPESSRVAENYFLPTTVAYDDVDAERAGYAKKRSAPNRSRELLTDSAEPSSSSSSSSRESIVPLKYNDGSSAEDQARLKQTVQRFFSMLQKQPCKYTRRSLST